MEENKKVNGKGEISMSLYEINQNIISQLPEYNNEEINNLQNKINEWEGKYSSNHYFMLLCNDIHYYTILHSSPALNNDFSSLGQAVVELLLERDFTIHSNEILEDHCEIWIKTQAEETFVFILFPYDQGVVTYS